jgi:hypothetical protein
VFSIKRLAPASDIMRAISTAPIIVEDRKEGAFSFRRASAGHIANKLILVVDHAGADTGSHRWFGSSQLRSKSG